MESEYAGDFAEFLRRHGMEGVVIIDAEGKILSANRTAESLLGYGAGQLTNLYVSDVWSGIRSPGRGAAERPRPQDVELTRRNGEPLAVTLDVSPLNGSTEGDRLLSFMKRDELERINESLLHAQRLAGIGTLTASVAHELTNPISIITTTCANLADELQDETVDRAELLQAVELIEQSAFRCARIVEVLRHYAHSVGPATDGAAGDGAAIAISSPAAIVQDALTMVEQQFRKQARVTVETELQAELTTIFCDHHRLTQVLINLLINARDAMQPVGGVVRVKFWTPDLNREKALAARIRTSLRLPGNGHGPGRDDLFAFSVADTGTGIAPEIMERMFEPFFTTKPRGQGTGLGLFIAQGIVTEHGGCIYAENNPDGGATFTVVLPRRQ